MAIQQIKVAAALHGGTGPAKLALKQFIGKLRTIVRVNNIRCLVANEGDKATVTVIFEVGEKVPAELPGLYDFLAEKTGTSVKQMRQSRLKSLNCFCQGHFGLYYRSSIRVYYLGGGENYGGEITRLDNLFVPEVR